MRLIFYRQKQMNTVQHYNTPFRQKFIRMIISLRDRLSWVPRSTECLAITISDWYEHHLEIKNQNDILDELDVEVYVMTLLWISWKIHRHENLTLKKFIAQKTSDEKIQETSSKICQYEVMILEKMDYEVPLCTAYDLLNLEIPEYEYRGKNRKGILVKCLKIFMNAVENSAILSLRPNIGKQFYHIRKYGEGSELGMKLYNESIKRIKSDQNRKG